jgi:hypothetical protein
MDWHSRLRLSRDGNSFEGVARLTRTNVDEAVAVLNFCATLTGVRVSL